MSDQRYMHRALELAERGRGAVEPNPLVGCVIVARDQIVGEGWHQRFGGPHAEIEALAMAGEVARGADLYVTLEPCCHFGKTPPCSAAIIAAGLRRVVAAVTDPFPQVAGGGLQQLTQAGIEVSVGPLAEESRNLNAPYWKLTTRGWPWIIAKWAMTLDGKIASRSGDSRWISNESSRAVVHRIRGRVDGILVGRGTVQRDDPLLTARPPGLRTAARIILDSNASLSLESKLVHTIREAPVLVVVGTDAPAENRLRLEAAGCEIVTVPGKTWSERLPALLSELGRRRMTNVLVEGGPTTLGGFWQEEYVDEVHVFVAPKLLGGQDAPGPFGGFGAQSMADAWRLHSPRIEQLDGDVHISGRIKPHPADQTNRSPRSPAIP